MTDSMRIVLASLGVEGFSLLHETCERSGHVPVAYACSRSRRPRQQANPHAIRTIDQLLRTLPPAVDLLLPANAVGLGAALDGYRADLLVIYGFNWILPPEVFQVPRFGAINIHASLLPRYRGPAPVLSALRNGDPDIGVTIHRVDEGIDTGPILAQQGGIPLDEEITPQRLQDRLDPVIQDPLTTALDRVTRGVSGQPQSTADLGYAGLLETEFFKVDWSRSAWEIHNQVRVFRFIGSADAPVARVGDQWLRLVRTSREPADGVLIECADGPLWITESTPAVAPTVKPGLVPDHGLR